MKKIKTIIVCLLLSVLTAGFASAQRDTVNVEPGKDGFFLLYPNPTPTNIIKVNYSYLQCISVKVYDMSGGEVKTKNCPDFPAGMLIMELDPAIAVSGSEFYVVLTERNKVYKEKLLVRE